MKKGSLIFIFVAGIVVGVATVLFIQSRYYPVQREIPNLSAEVSRDVEKDTMVRVSNDTVKVELLSKDEKQLTLLDYGIQVTVPSVVKPYLVTSEYVQERDEVETILYLCTDDVYYDRNNQNYRCPSDGIKIWINADGLGGGCNESLHRSIQIDGKTFQGCWFDQSFSIGTSDIHTFRVHLSGSYGRNDLFTEDTVLSILSGMTLGE